MSYFFSWVLYFRDALACSLFQNTCTHISWIKFVRKMFFIATIISSFPIKRLKTFKKISSAFAIWKHGIEKKSEREEKKELRRTCIKYWDLLVVSSADVACTQGFIITIITFGVLLFNVPVQKVLIVKSYRTLCKIAQMYLFFLCFQHIFLGFK